MSLEELGVDEAILKVIIISPIDSLSLNNGPRALILTWTTSTSFWLPRWADVRPPPTTAVSSP
jgi:hypothetical protein